NVLHILRRVRSCWQERCRLPDNEDHFLADGRLSARSRISRETRLPIGDGPDVGGREIHPSAVKVFPFHESCYDRRLCPRYGACVGFCSVTCEAILVPSFEVNHPSRMNTDLVVPCECYFRLKRIFFGAPRPLPGNPVVSAQ